MSNRSHFSSGREEKDKDTSGTYRPSERREKRRIFSLFYSFSFQKVAVFSILGYTISEQPKDLIYQGFRLAFCVFVA